MLLDNAGPMDSPKENESTIRQVTRLFFEVQDRRDTRGWPQREEELEPAPESLKHTRETAHVALKHP